MRFPRFFFAVMTAVTLTVSLASASGFEAELDDWRKTRAERLTTETSWTSLVGLHWLDADAATSIGSASDNGIVVSGLPDRLGVIERDGDDWWFAPVSEVETEIDGQASSGPALLVTDAAAARAGRSPTRVKSGTVVFVLIERGDRVGVRIWDANAPGRLRFAGIESFPAAPDWRVTATWEPHDPAGAIDIATVIGTVEPMPNPGAASFERDGRRYRLEALQEDGSDQLFFIFADRTSGKSTYGAGRYLYASLPGPDGTVMLDFNRAYNPPCAFSAFATCPLPPPENRLDLSIEAGEKKYRKPVAN